MAFELKAIPLSFNNSFKTGTVSTSLVNIWFNNKRQREDPATSTTTVTANDDVVVCTE